MITGERTVHGTFIEEARIRKRSRSDIQERVREMATKKKRAQASTASTLVGTPTDLLEQARQVLGRIPTVKLRRMLKDKKILNRSKLRTKDMMVNALCGLVDVAELEKNGYKSKKKITLPVVARENPERKNMVMWRKEGKRWNEPVMGTDIHKDVIAWAVVSPEGLVKEGMLENTIDGLQVLIQLCNAECIAMVAMESTAEYWLLPYWELTEKSIPVLVANPVQVKAVMGVKTDKLDARRIAFGLRDGRLRPSVACTREQFALRKDMRDMVTQVEHATAAKNRVRQILHKAGAPKPVSKAFKSDRGISILTSLPGCRTRKEVLDLITLAYASYRGKIDDAGDLEDIAGMYWDLLSRIIINKDLDRLILDIDEIHACETRISQLELSALKYARDHPAFLADVNLLLTITGLGQRTTLIIMAEIVDITFFPKSQGLSRWAGIVPATKQSGYRKRINGRIFKSGNKFLRRACFIVAESELGKQDQPGHPITRFMRHLIVDKKKEKMKAIAAGAHKLLLIIHAMLTRKQPFISIADEMEQARVEKNKERKMNELARMLEVMSVDTFVTRFLPRVKARFEASLKIGQLVNELAATLLGDKVAAQAMENKGGG